MEMFLRTVIKTSVFMLVFQVKKQSFLDTLEFVMFFMFVIYKFRE